MNTRLESFLRNLAHVASGVLIANPNHNAQLAGALLAGVATAHAQKNRRPPRPPTGAVPVAIHRGAPLLAL